MQIGACLAGLPSFYSGETGMGTFPPYLAWEERQRGSN